MPTLRTLWGYFHTFLIISGRPISIVCTVASSTTTLISAISLKQPYSTMVTRAGLIATLGSILFSAFIFMLRRRFQPGIGHY